VVTDDIVTRLREEADSWCHDSAVRVFLEAADEIERLRADRDRWRDLADSLARFGNCESSDCPTCNHNWKLTYQDYEQAVRGE